MLFFSFLKTLSASFIHRDSCLGVKGQPAIYFSWYHHVTMKLCYEPRGAKAVVILLICAYS